MWSGRSLGGSGTRRRVTKTLVVLASLQVCISFIATAGASALPVAQSLHAAGSAGSWGSAEELPGTGALNLGGRAALYAISCSANGACSAGGSYTDGSGNVQAFVATKTGSSWGNAEEVPGTATLNAGGFAEVSRLSCPSANSCAAGGLYTDSSSHEQAFVADEVDGTWGSAEEVPGTAALNSGGNAEVYSVSCTSAGDCAAGGLYLDGGGLQQAFVVAEVNGTWGSAEEVPGTAALNAAGFAQVDEVSCTSSGNCAAVGYYAPATGRRQAFVVNEVNGTWENAEEIPGTATLNAGGFASADQVSCPSLGNCSAGGSYVDSAGHNHAFVVSESSGTWGNAEEVPGAAVLNAGGDAEVVSLSCGSAGNCAAGGLYVDGASHQQAFVVSESNGTWGSAEEVPGTAALNSSGFAEVVSLSCASAGNCAAGGYYADGSEQDQAFVVNETSGKWGTAQQIPGTAVLNVGGDATVYSLSCTTAGTCSSGGFYADGSGHEQAFIVNYTPPSPSITRISPSHGPPAGGTFVTITGKSLFQPTAVHFGARLAKIRKIVSATGIEVFSPKGSGTVDVTVTTAGGTSAKTKADRFKY